MGARGVLKLAPRLSPVPVAVAGSAAADVSAVAPDKPPVVADDSALSAAWDLIVPGLDSAGLVSKADLPALVLALMHYTAAVTAYGRIGNEIVIEDAAHSGVKKNPAEAVFRLESDQFLRFAQQLGMTFVSRARTPSVKGVSDGEANPFKPA